jgi:DNA invertase Pin-like site-specific DNA recombinase
LGVDEMNRTYGYIRVSSSEQNTDRQIEALKDNAVEERFIFTDKQSGKDFNRPEYQVLKNALREKDLLVIKSIDRLGRNYKEIVNEWKYITEEIKADIKVIDMPLLDTTQHKDLLGNFISDLILQVLSYVAQQERDYIKKRQEEGIKSAQDKGKHLGRPKAELPEGAEKVLKEWREKKISAKEAMKQLNMKPTTFYKLAK